MNYGVGQTHLGQHVWGERTGCLLTGGAMLVGGVTTMLVFKDARGSQVFRKGKRGLASASRCWISLMMFCGLLLKYTKSI